MNEEFNFVDYLAQISQSDEGFSGSYFTFTTIMKVILWGLSFVSIVLIVIIFTKIFEMVRKEKQKLLNPSVAPKTKEEVAHSYFDDWEQIKQFANSLQESEWKLAVIQADKLVDEVLKSAGYQGESMGERLMTIDPKGFVSLQELWEAHKLRNIIVHDMTQAVGKDMAVRAINSYENFLKEIGFFSSS